MNKIIRGMEKVDKLLRKWPFWISFLIGFQTALIFCKIADPIKWPWWEILLPAIVSLSIVTVLLLWTWMILRKRP